MGESMEGLGQGVLEMIKAGLALPDDALSLSRSRGVEHLSICHTPGKVSDYRIKPPQKRGQGGSELLVCQGVPPSNAKEPPL